MLIAALTPIVNWTRPLIVYKSSDPNRPSFDLVLNYGITESSEAQ